MAGNIRKMNRGSFTNRKLLDVGISITANHLKSAIIRKNANSRYEGQAAHYPIGQLGNSVYDGLILKVAIDTAVGLPLTSKEYAKFESVIITVNQDKNIVRTPIQGRNGTVKEYISDGDFDINITGLIVSKNPFDAPLEDMENIIEMLKLPNEIVIISDYLALFKIQYAVVHSSKFNQIEGSQNQIQMDIRLLSDEPIELKLGINPNA
jgi:hypothetical protein